MLPITTPSARFSFYVPRWMAAGVIFLAVALGGGVSAQTSDYGDHFFSSTSSASQAASTAIFIGTQPTDAEASDPSNANANADSLAGINDEDLTMPTFTVGYPTTLSFAVSISGTVATSRMNVFVDWNGDGDVADTGETQTVQSVTSSGTRTFTLTPPAGTTAGTKYLRIRFVEGSTAPAFSGTSALRGEVEDYAISVATNDLGDWNGSGAASTTTNSTVDVNLRLGATIDAETTVTPDAAATADGADDDGVTMPILYQGTSVTIPVSVYNNTGSTAYLAAWIDFNNDGSFNGLPTWLGGELLELSHSVASSSTATTQNVTFTVPSGASIGTQRGVRFRLTNQSSPGATGTEGIGEVEDYVVTIKAPLDYGDLADGTSGTGVGDYQTLLANGGPSHRVVSGLKLGATIDYEADGQPTTAADGDGTDDDGVATLPALVAGELVTFNATATNTTGSAANLSVWIDFNNNGNFEDAGEKVASDIVVADGTSGGTIAIPSFGVPTTVTIGAPLGMRLRLSNQTSLTSIGASTSGEVEDYLVWAAPAIGAFATKLNTASNAVSGAGASGIPSLQNFYVPAGTNRVIFITAMFEREHIQAGDSLTSYADLGDNFASPTLMSSVFQINATFTGPAGSRTVNNPLALPAGDLRFGAQTNDYNPPPTYDGSFISRETYFIAIYESDIAAILGSSAGYITVTLPNVVAPKDSADDAGLLGFVFSNVQQNASGIVRSGVLTNVYGFSASAPLPGNYTLSVPTLDSGDEPTRPQDGFLLFGFSGLGQPSSPGGFLTSSGFTELANLVTNNANGDWLDNTEPDGISASGQFRNGLASGTITSASMQSAGSSSLASTGGIMATFTLHGLPIIDFGDYTSFASAGSTVDTGLKIGPTSPDAEFTATLNATATGDDITGTADENSVTLPSTSQGSVASFSVPVTNLTSSPAYLSVWIDFNNNGSLADAGEQVLVNATIPSGTNNVNTNVTFTVPLAAVPGNRGLRIRLCSVSNPGPTGTTGLGEVEDYLITVNSIPTLDFGDHIFGTLGASTASQTASTEIKIGTNATDAEATDPSNSNATADNTTGTNDEDLTMPSFVLGSATTLSIPVTISGTVATSRLNVFVDWNGDGDVADTGETQTVQSVTSSGTRSFTMTPPVGTVAGTKYLRIRFVESTTAPSFSGASVLKGEVEDYAITVACPTITVAPASLSNGVVGTAYSQTVSASGGISPYTFSVSAGSLPSWATLNASTGAITGTPNSATSASFTIRASDATACIGTLAYTITPVCPTITVAPASLSNGTVGTAYSQTISASGGTSPYTFSVSAGSLPTGITLSSAGVLSGTATGTAMNYLFTVQATDANGCTSTLPSILPIQSAAVTVAPATLPAGSQGIAYSQALSASPAATYNWTVSAGTLPTGLSLNASSGVLSGTPTVSGSSSFTVTAGTTTALPQLEFCTYNIDLNPGQTFNLRDYVRIKGAAGASAIDWSQVYFTYTLVGASNPTVPADWHLTEFNAGQNVTLVAADQTYAGNQGTGEYRIYLARNGQSGFDDKATIRVSSSATSALASGRCSPPNTFASSGSRAYTLVINYSTDFGDHIFGTLAASSASQFASTDIKIGTSATDAEVTDPSNSNATADNTTGTNDEDLTMPSFVVGSATTLSIPVTISGTVATSRLNVFVDWNGDGDVLDASETQSVQSVTSSGTKSFSLTPPVGTIPGTKYLRIRLTEGSAAPTFAGASALRGEVEDYPITVNAPLPQTDFGDWSGAGAQTLTTSSLVVSNLRLGALVDAEPSVVPNATATADDQSGSSDEDGATLPVSITQNANVTLPVTVFNNTGSSAYLNAWIDFNNDGVFDDNLLINGGERLEAARTIVSGASATVQNISFTVPSSASAGALRGVRFRLTNQISTLPVGAVGSGEVEDYAITLNQITLTPALANGFVGNGYTQTLTASGGIGPYTFSQLGGTLPQGLTLNSSTGIISGVPTTSGSYTFSIKATEVSTGYGTQTYTVVIGQITLTPTLPNGFVGNSYTQTVTANGGAGPYTFAQLSGTLPPGLSLNPSTGNISGTPTTTGSYTFVLKATDQNGIIGTQSYTVGVGQITLTPTLPNGLVGNSYTQTVTANGGAGPYTFAQLSGTLPPGLSLNPSTGNISGTPTTTGSYTFVLKATDQNGIIGTQNYTVAIGLNTDYGDWDGAGAQTTTTSSFVDTNIRLGAAVDSEASVIPNAAATADDLTGSDDEDGIASLPSLIQGQSASISINVTNTSSATAYLSAWIDFNNDGAFGNDSTETLYAQPVAIGASNLNVTMTFLVPGAAVLGNRGLRVRISSDPAMTAVGAYGSGEIEDYIITVSTPAPLDYGDLPDTGSGTGVGNYQTLSADNGPSHILTATTLRLGATADADTDGQPNITATGDGADEDGIASFPAFIQGLSANISVSVFNNTGSTAKLYGFIDWNGDGSFSPTIETLTAVNVPSSASQQTLTLTALVPTGIANGSVGARFRLSSDSALTSVGAASNGEVEDYLVTITQLDDHGDYSLFADASASPTTSIRLGSTVTDAEAPGLGNATATGDDGNGADDEDGAAVPTSFSIGVANSLTINVTNTSGVPAFLSVWIDFNGNNALEVGEQIISNVSIVNGTNSQDETYVFNVPGSASYLANVGVRVRISSTSGTGPVGAGGLGEVEDYRVKLCPPKPCGVTTLIANP